VLEKMTIGRQKKTWKDVMKMDLELLGVDEIMRMWHWIEEDGERSSQV